MRIILTITAGAIIAVIETIRAALHCRLCSMISSIGIIGSILFAFATEGCDEGRGRGGGGGSVTIVSSWVDGCRYATATNWSGEGCLDVVESEPPLPLSDCAVVVIVHIQGCIISHRIA